MVAIVSGNSLGLNLTSSGVLGAQGTYGDPRTGQGGEQVYVNASTGNLVMQQLQDQLVASGLDVTSVLTYNSLGLATDDNGDNFSIGKVPAQLVLSGTVNTAGSTLTRTAFDGSQTVYTWDAANSRYVAVNGTGAFDTITYAASKYTWVDGATQQLETYDGTTGRLLTRVDSAGNTLTFGYDPTSGMLKTVTADNGDVVTYVYSGTLLTQINAPVTTWVGGVATTSVQPVVKYGYDTSNRLTSVTVDLTPDGSTTDGKVYTTSFNYDGTSKRVHTMWQSDGTQLTFVYDGSNRVYTITDALNNVTQFTYDTVNLKTSVLANGQTTVYAYNTAGQLLSVTAPVVNGVAPVTQYAYNANGEVVSAIDPDGRTTSMAYDAAGNQVSVLGQVNRPGRYPLEQAQTRLSDVLALAGGIANPQGGDIVTVVGTRAGKPMRLEVDLPKLFSANSAQQDLDLQNNDVVWVDRAPIVYIYGEVQRPGPLRLERGMTVMQALAAGGGLTQRGTERGIRIHRRNEATGSVDEVQPTMDSSVRDGDVIYVRESLF